MGNNCYRECMDNSQQIFGSFNEKFSNLKEMLGEAF